MKLKSLLEEEVLSVKDKSDIMSYLTGPQFSRYYTTISRYDIQ